MALGMEIMATMTLLRMASMTSMMMTRMKIIISVDVQAPGRRGGQWVGRLTRTPTPSQVS